MVVFFQFFFRILAFAVFVTGFCSLLNYTFDWHLSIEGTEAPAEFDASIMLICFAITLFMWGEFAANNSYVVKVTKKWHSLIGYILFSILISALPSIYFYKADENFSILYEALAEKDLSEFQNKENLKKLSQKNLNRLFAESIRRNSPEFTQILSEFLQDVNGDKKSPNVFLAAYLSNPKVFAILIQRKADFSIKEEYLGNTVLHSVVTGNGSMPDKIKVIQMLAEKNLVSVDITDKFNATPLMNAVERGESQVAETLLTLNADFRRVDHVGNPILTRVCEKTSLYPELKEEDRIRTVQVLLKHGADKYVKDYLGRDCKELALRDGLRKLAEIF